MRYDFSNNEPIFLQIEHFIRLHIFSGKYKPGEKIASVRDLAQEYEVNPNTMQRALSDLESEKLLFSQRTSGRFVTENKTLIAHERDKLAAGYVENCLTKLKELGYSPQEISALMQQANCSGNGQTG